MQRLVDGRFVAIPRVLSYTAEAPAAWRVVWSIMNPRHSARFFIGCSLMVLLGCDPADDPAGGGVGTGDGGTDLPRDSFGNPTTVIASSGGEDDADGGDIDGSAGMVCAERTLVDKVDLLFMVDNSNSMREEQAALQAQFPKLIRTLTTGERFEGDPNPFPPAKDLHLAVVSSDMGITGVTGISKCDEGFGDDGIMIDPTERSCPGGVPGERFLTYQAGKTDPEDLADTFACLAVLGTDGCGFEQQLESTLKALWPSVDGDLATDVTFLKDALGYGDQGHGDLENNGFLRTDLKNDPSVLAVVVVTDEEDCSSLDTSHFRPMSQLAPIDPNYNVGLNVRCLENPDNLYPVKRYADGYRALRGGREDLVVFAAIVGVPTNLVDNKALAKVDLRNASSRNAFYDRILDDPRMQPVPVETTPGHWNLKPSCDTPIGVAYPPVRIVKLAKEIGENAIVQSICQDDFGPAIDAIIDRVSIRLQDTCFVE